MFLVLLALLTCLPDPTLGGCEYYTNCAACVADTTCGWCGNDPYHAGGYGFTLQGDHVEGSPFSPTGYMVGGIGKVYNTGDHVVMGINTVFTRQFRGRSDDSTSNPFSLVVTIRGTTYTYQVDQVWSDTEMTLTIQATVPFSTPQRFSLALPRGTGDIWFGPVSSEVFVPTAGNVEQRTLVCGAGNSLPTSPVPTAPGACKFTKELQPGYLIVLDGENPPRVRTVTSIVSDTELTVDFDFHAGFYTSGPLPHSSSVLATAGHWTYLSCPPRVGKLAIGLGVIESHWDQSSNFEGSGAIANNSGDLMSMSGGGTLSQHRIMGRGTRFETQFGMEVDNWPRHGSGGYYNLGPWLSVRLNYDWETQRVLHLGTSGSYAEYVAVLANSFSEPLLKHIHFNWYTMLEKGRGRIRAKGRRVFSEAWMNYKAPTPYDVAAIGAGAGVTSGSTQFSTQLATGYSITAAGQTRMVNAILSDTELTIDRPFTLGNREFFSPSSSQAWAGTLNVRGLTRTKPFWPTGVSVEVVVTAVAPVRYKYNVLYRTFKYTVDGDGNSSDNCTVAMINGGTVCGLTADASSWVQLTDPERQEMLGVYIKWDPCDIGVCASHTTAVGVLDSWRFHIADIEDVDFYFSRESERYMTDDNHNPPLCYNSGRCLAIGGNATTIGAAKQRPSYSGAGLLHYNATTFLVEALPDWNGNMPTFTVSLSPGELIRILVDGTDPTTWVDIRVIQINSDVELVSDYGTSIGNATTAFPYSVLKCPAGRRSGASHDASVTTPPANSAGVEPDDSMMAYLPHPQQTFYHTWSYQYCEVDPGCCGFKVSSVVDPQQFGYYAIKPDHSNYNYRTAVFTVNDNLDLYTRRADEGSGRPDTTNYDLTSVRESNPWAIDQDQPSFYCQPTQHLAQSAMGNGSSAGWLTPASAYDTTVARYTQQAHLPDCVPWVTGVMGDNRYPLTTGPSEYHARMFLEFNFPNFACADSGLSGSPKGGFTGQQGSFKQLCMQEGLRFVRDADVVFSAASNQYVLRLTESRQRSGGTWKPWHVDGVEAFPTLQRSGAVWWSKKVHIWDGFEMDFTFQVTEPSQCGGADKICDGADGFAFVFSNDARQESGVFDCSLPDCSDGMIGCPADGLGYGSSKMTDPDYWGNVQECQTGLQKAFSLEFDTFHNRNKWDPKQGKTSWWINATEFISYSDNHIGAFMTTDPWYPNQPWGQSLPNMRAMHSDDENGAHFGSTPSVPTLADGQVHHVKIRYTRGFTTEKTGSGQISTTDISTEDADGRRLLGDQNTKFKAELRTGFEFGYANRVKANVKVKMFRDKTAVDPDTGANLPGRFASPVPGVNFPDDGEACRVIKVIDDSTANLEDTSLNATAEEIQVRLFNQPPFNPEQSTAIPYNIIKEFPGEVHVFIDDMDRWAFTTAVEDRDIAKILDSNGNAYIGFTASSGSKGFARAGYDPVDVHQTTDILSWRFCGNPGCVPY